MGLLPPVIAFLLISICCWLFVCYAMYEYEGISSAVLGLTVLFAFYWGWHNPKARLGSIRIGDVMTAWSWFLAVAIVLKIIMGDST